MMLKVGFSKKMMADPVTTLSGGWRMKLALSRAMCVTQRPFPSISELQLRVDGVDATRRHRGAVAAAARESCSSFVTVIAQAPERRHPPHGRAHEPLGCDERQVGQGLY